MRGSASSTRDRRTAQTTGGPLGRWIATSRRLALRLLAGIRSSLQGGEWPTALVSAGGGRPVLVRARPESVQLTETYFYEQKIARNQRTTARQAPTGRIEVVVPYDGERFFGRQARQDVLRQLGPGAPPGTEALIGHLALLAADRTDLASVADLGGPSGSVPLLVPVTLGNLGHPGWLRDDRRACEIGYDYRPDDPERFAVEVRLRLEDEEEWIPTGKSRESLDRQAVQASSFHPDLLVRLDVKLRLPSRSEEPSTPPRVSRVALDWPSLTSLRGLRLTVADDRHPFAYDPEASRLTWTDVPIEPVRRRPSDADHRYYASKPMTLAIHQPGELYQETSLGGRVEVEVPGCLLSGLQARLFDGTGRRCDDPEPELSSRLVLDFRLVLDEAFARRRLHPYQLLYFDELIPDHLRLADIKAALHDRGFRVEEPIKDLSTADPDDLAAYLLATHPRGPDVMQLWLLVYGRRHPTRRRARVKGGLTYTTAFESGELRIRMGGQVPGDGKVATHEMNELHAALRDWFERLRARR
jgi:hypothetical protein